LVTKPERKTNIPTNTLLKQEKVNNTETIYNIEVIYLINIKPHFGRRFI